MKHAVNLALAIGVLTTLGGCTAQSVKQRTLAVRGRIVKQSADAVWIDLGSADRIAIGNQLTVYRATLMGTPKQAPYYADQNAGTIRVDHVVSAHLASAMLVEGTATKGEWVESRQLQ